jgi:hypothetical protein
MKKIAAFAGLAFAAAAWAQQPAAPAAAPTTPAAPSTAPAAPAATPPAQVAKSEPKKPARKPNPHRQEDARHCLDKPTNTEIIKCAEAYL